MSLPILATKLHRPVPRPNAVPRPHLVTRLNEGLVGKMTLVSAPAGFGKSSLVAEWLVGVNRPVAWLSLEATESDPQRFLTYFIAALQSVAPGVGQTISPASGPSPLSDSLAILVNDISQLREDIVLVLDDYHLVEARLIDEALTFFVTHLPTQLHLVVVSREDPTWPLSRLRANGQLSEIRAADLRFSNAEAATFLNQLIGLSLTDDDVEALQRRTEGWAAGLQLAAVSLRSRANSQEFIEAFTGSNRFVLDYLVEEVLQQQSEPVRNFLLHTAILHELNGSLCDAVTQLPDSSALLANLDRENLFIIPLDEERSWYRYHHLFGEMLRSRAPAAVDSPIADLHLRAAAWYAEAGRLAEAIEHAHAAKDFGKMAEYVEAIWPSFEHGYRGPTFRGWIEALPEEIVASSPQIAVGYVWTLLDEGELDAAENWIGLTEALVTDSELGPLKVSINTARAYQAQTMGDSAATIRFANEALRHVADRSGGAHLIPEAMIGLADWATGDLEAAFERFMAVRSGYHQQQNHVLVIGATLLMIDLRLEQNRLREATQLIEQAEAFTDGRVFHGIADLRRLRAQVALLQGEWERCRTWLDEGYPLMVEGAVPGNEYHWQLLEAGLKIVHGDEAAALDLIDQAEAGFVGSPYPIIRPFDARRVRLQLRQGQVESGRRWFDGVGADSSDYLGTYRQIARAEALAATGDVAGAGALLSSVRAVATDGGWQRLHLECLIALAIVQQSGGDEASARAIMVAALKMAQAEQIVWEFVFAFATIESLLNKIQATESSLTTFVAQIRRAARPLGEAGTQMPNQEGLVEPLSERELEVLRLVAEGLSNREIGERLFLALSTVKGHNRIIFDKLQVGRRTEAVKRAQELGLI